MAARLTYRSENDSSKLLDRQQSLNAGAAYAGSREACQLVLIAALCGGEAGMSEWKPVMGCHDR